MRRDTRSAPVGNDSRAHILMLHCVMGDHVLMLKDGAGWSPAARRRRRITAERLAEAHRVRDAWSAVRQVNCGGAGDGVIV